MIFKDFGDRIKNASSFAISFFSAICLLLSLLNAYLFSKLYPFDVKEIIQIKMVIYTLIGGFILLYLVYFYLKTIDFNVESYCKTPDFNNILSIIYIFITCFIIANLLTRTINSFDFYSAETIIKYRIDDKRNNVRDNKYITRRGKSKIVEAHQVRNYYLVLKEKNNSKTDEKIIEVNSSTYSDAEIGDDYIIKLKPGFLGLLHYNSFPEILHNHEYEKIWAERRKQWKE